MPEEMYVIVRFGDNEEIIFNAECRCISLLYNIREKCLCEDDGEVDLSDENGNVKQLRSFPNRYASEILCERERLVLVRVEQGDNNRPVYIPLLNNDDFLTDTFLGQLASNSNSEQASSRRLRSLRGGVRSDNKTKSTTNGNNKDIYKAARILPKSKTKLK